jgi:hypothetical protein
MSLHWQEQVSLLYICQGRIRSLPNCIQFYVFLLYCISILCYMSKTMASFPSPAWLGVQWLGVILQEHAHSTASTTSTLAHSCNNNSNYIHSTLPLPPSHTHATTTATIFTALYHFHPRTLMQQQKQLSSQYSTTYALAHSCNNHSK